MFGVVGNDDSVEFDLNCVKFEIFSKFDVV